MISWELYTYSLAGIVFGLVLMAIGILRHGVVTRWASLVVLLVVTAKVFLYDVSELGDLYRVLSFLCLGAALMGLGYVYQRYVFGAAPPEPAAE